MLQRSRFEAKLAWLIRRAANQPLLCVEQTARCGLAVDSLQKTAKTAKKAQTVHRQTRPMASQRCRGPTRGSGALGVEPLTERPSATRLRAGPRLGCLLRRLGARSGIRQHAERALVEVEEALLLVVLILVHFGDFDELAHDLRLEAGALGLGVDFLDVFAERALFVFEPLDALDQRFELLTSDAPEIGHVPPHPRCDAAPRRRRRR